MAAFASCSLKPFLATTPDMKSATPQRQRGLTLIESLVAIFVAALGVLGIIGAQMRH